MTCVAVVGSGTMGSGIAQVAAQAGWDVRLMDVEPAITQKAVDGIVARLDRLIEKGKLSAAQRDQAAGRLHVAAGATDLAGCELLIEAVVEDLGVKVNILGKLLPAMRADCIIASNTSSLSISAIGAGIGRAGRTVGMHFFNPVPLMPLVEIIAGRESEPTAVDRAAEVAAGWGKIVVRVKDTPGFIVNRVARGYYLESLRMLGEGVAGLDEIDHIMRTLGGFRMGPFELMDLVGIDVNYTVSCSVWEQLGRPLRLTPHPIQKHLFDRGLLGRKTGRGFYIYGGGTGDQPAPVADHPMPAVPVDRRSFDCPPPLYNAVRRFYDGASTVGASSTEQYIFSRVLATIINEAALLLDEEGATEADIDTAMKLGTNYPKGPLEWSREIGRYTCAGLLRALNEVVADGRFAPAKWFA